MLPFDLHVSSLPLAFILSQDQTLHITFLIVNTKIILTGIFITALRLSSIRLLAYLFCLLFFLLFQVTFSNPKASISIAPFERLFVFLNTFLSKGNSKGKTFFLFPRTFLENFLKMFFSAFQFLCPFFQKVIIKVTQVVPYHQTFFEKNIIYFLPITLKSCKSKT